MKNLPILDFRSTEFKRNSKVGDEYQADGNRYRVTSVTKMDKDTGFILVICKRVLRNGTLGKSGFDVKSSYRGLTTLTEFRK